MICSTELGRFETPVLNSIFLSQPLLLSKSMARIFAALFITATALFGVVNAAPVATPDAIAARAVGDTVVCT